MNILTSIPFQPTYKKTDSDIWILNIDDVPVDVNLINDQQIVYLGPKAVGGNHAHPRTEWFIGIGDLKLITVPPFLPHAVVNQSPSSMAILYEFADMKQKDVESITVIGEWL